MSILGRASSLGKRVLAAGASAGAGPLGYGMGLAAAHPTAARIARHAAIGAGAGAAWETFGSDGSMLGGAARGAMAGMALGAGARRLSGIRANPAFVLANAARGVGGRAFMGAASGAALGGAYGLFADDTTVLGGAMKSAIAGGAIGVGVHGGARYGKAAIGSMGKYMKATQTIANSPLMTMATRSAGLLKAGAKGATQLAMKDAGRLGYGGTRLRNNSAFQAVRSSLKGW